MEFSVELSNARAQEIISKIGDAGKLVIKDASDNPLITLVCGTPFAPAPVNGVVTANDISTPNTAVLAGIATKADITKSDGTLVIRNLSVGTSGAQVILTSTTIVEFGSVVITSCVITEQNVAV